jgi:hypothetical protein
VSEPLSRLQLDILELEARTWPLDGAKISEFRRRHPNITETAYYVALHRMLTNQAALEHGNHRYAPMLRRLHQQQSAQIDRRNERRPVTSE